MMVESKVLASRGRRLAIYGTWTVYIGSFYWLKYQFSQIITVHGKVCISVVSITKLSSLGGQRSVTDALALAISPRHATLPVS